jgi:hypothetical protein
MTKRPLINTMKQSQQRAGTPRKTRRPSFTKGTIDKHRETRKTGPRSLPTGSNKQTNSSTISTLLSSQGSSTHHNQPHNRPWGNLVKLTGRAAPRQIGAAPLPVPPHGTRPNPGPRTSSAPVRTPIEASEEDVAVTAAHRPAVPQRRRIYYTTSLGGSPRGRHRAGRRPVVTTRRGSPPPWCAARWPPAP